MEATLTRPERAHHGAYIAAEFVASDGNKRVIEGKRFGREFRVYRIYGDVTDREALAEVAQMIAIEYDCDTVVFK